ncbi:MAG: Smr/MutS family protein [Clostridiales bacterium]|nr:Smr/MutS family protein [Clostridiales bacterium]
MYESIVKLDLHGKNTYQARVALDAVLRRARCGTYRIRCIHGCHGGTALRDMIRSEYARHPKVIRLEAGADGGTTDLVLREL